MLFWRKTHPDETLIGRIKILREDLRNIAELEDMTNMPGWVKLRAALEDEIRQCEVTRFDLDGDPVKNERQLITLREFERALNLILSTVDNTIGSKFELLKLQKEYERLSEDAQMKKAFTEAS